MNHQLSPECASAAAEILTYLCSVENTFAELAPVSRCLKGATDEEYIEAAQLLIQQRENINLEADKWFASEDCYGRPHKNGFLAKLSDVHADKTHLFQKTFRHEMPAQTFEGIMNFHQLTNTHVRGDKLRDIFKLASPWHTSNPTSSWRLQWYMRRLVAEESAETKKRMYNEFSKLIENPVVPVTDSKPSVSVHYTPGNLPIEVMGYILEACSLETCVALRQVSSAWYSAYTFFGAIIKDHLLDRTVDLQLDSALVYVSRLKWQKVEYDQFWDDFEPVFRTKYGIVAQPASGKLPEDFELISAPWNTLSFDRVFTLDLKSLTFQKIRQVDFQELETHDGEVHALFGEFTLILPSSITSIDQFEWNNEAIVVICVETATLYVLPWHSLDYRENRGFEMAYEKQQVYCHRKESPMIMVERGSHFVLDMAGRRFVEIPWMLGHYDQVLTVYNGLYWCYFDFFKSIVPFFLDNINDEIPTMHVQTDRAVYVQRDSYWKVNGRFLYQKYQARGQDGRMSVEVVDLETGTATMIVHDENENKGKSYEYFVGFSEGRLKAWSYMMDEQLFQYEKALAALNEGGQEEVYDVSGTQELEVE